MIRIAMEITKDGNPLHLILMVIHPEVLTGFIMETTTGLFLYTSIEIQLTILDLFQK